MKPSNLSIQTLNQHHNELYVPLVNWLEKNVPIKDGYTASQSAYEHIYTNWNTLGVRAKNPEKQSSYIDYIMMVIFDGDIEGYFIENPQLKNRIDKFTKFYNRLHKNLIK